MTEEDFKLMVIKLDCLRLASSLRTRHKDSGEQINFEPLEIVTISKNFFKFINDEE